MTPFIQVLTRLLQSFWNITKQTDTAIIFDTIPLQEITSKNDVEDASFAPIPAEVEVFSFDDTGGRRGEVEIWFKKETGELVNSIVRTFFSKMDDRNEYLKLNIDPFFSKGFQKSKHPKFPDLLIKEYCAHGLVFGLNCPKDMPILSVYVTLEGYE